MCGRGGGGSGSGGSDYEGSAGGGGCSPNLCTLNALEQSPNPCS